MTQTLTLTFLLTMALFACSSSESKDTSTDDSLVNAIDTSKKIVADDYPVTDDFLRDKSKNRRELKVGEVRSIDKIWLTNDSLQQTLGFEMYTDMHRMVIFHFLNNDVPDELVDQMELHVEDGELASLAQKKKALPGLIDIAPKIESRYFTSAKGFKLGDTKQKALSVYGAPVKEVSDNNLDVLEWHYAGDQNDAVSEELKARPRVKDSYGHQVKMFFKGGKLIAIILFNDIP